MKLGPGVRDEAVALYVLGYSLREIAARCDVALGSVHRWVSEDAPHLLRRPGIGRGMSPTERLEKCTRAA